jgi:hypothetical protein
LALWLELGLHRLSELLLDLLQLRLLLLPKLGLQLYSLLHWLLYRLLCRLLRRLLHRLLHSHTPLEALWCLSLKVGMYNWFRVFELRSPWL